MYCFFLLLNPQRPNAELISVSQGFIVLFTFEFDSDANLSLCFKLILISLSIFCGVTAVVYGFGFEVDVCLLQASHFLTYVLVSVIAILLFPS